jgi:hypothetical protein
MLDTGMMRLGLSYRILIAKQPKKNPCSRQEHFGKRRVRSLPDRAVPLPFDQLGNRRSGPLHPPVSHCPRGIAYLPNPPFVWDTSPDNLI